MHPSATCALTAITRNTHSASQPFGVTNSRIAASLAAFNSRTFANFIGLAAVVVVVASLLLYCCCSGCSGGCLPLAACSAANRPSAISHQQPATSIGCLLRIVKRLSEVGALCLPRCCCCCGMFYKRFPGRRTGPAVAPATRLVSANIFVNYYLRIFLPSPALARSQIGRHTLQGTRHFPRRSNPSELTASHSIATTFSCRDCLLLLLLLLLYALLLLHSDK